MLVGWQKLINQNGSFTPLRVFSVALGITIFASSGLGVDSQKAPSVVKEKPLILKPVESRDSFGSFSTLELDGLYKKIDKFINKKQEQRAVSVYLESVAMWQSLVKQNMKLGNDLNEDLERWEAFQIKLARRFMKGGGYKAAEEILLDISQRSPSNPVLTKLLDRLREERLNLGDS